MQRVLGSLRPEQLAKEVSPVWQARLDHWGNRVLDELGVDAKFDIRNPLVRQHLEHFAGNKMRVINESTQAALGEQLGEGIALGEGIDDLEGRVSEVFADASGWRAELIARTEVVGSSNFANLRAFVQSGVVESKEWLSVQDGETRETHAALDGQVIGLLEMFEAGDSRGAAPGQFNDPAEDCNCRCSVLPVVAEIEGKSAEDRLAVWKRFDVRAAAWERVAKAALRRGFAAQKTAALEMLRKVA